MTQAAAKIAAIAGALCTEKGVSSMTMRSVAARAGVSPPAVVYHFKTRERLLIAALRSVCSDLDGAYARLLVEFGPEVRRVISPAASISSMIMSLVSSCGPTFRARDEIARALATTPEASEANSVLIDDKQATDHFWDEVVPGSMDDDARAVIAAVAEGLIPYAMLDPSEARRNAHIIQLTARLFDRLEGRTVSLLASLDHPGPIEPVQRPAGKQQIVDATIRLSGRVGLAGLTHRNIASEAGLSVASTTYFYPTKQDIIADAAQALQARAVNAVIGGTFAPPKFMSLITLDKNGHERTDLAALAAFTSAATAATDGALADIFRSLRGSAAVQWLIARGHANVDRLDGIIWSAATTPLIRSALLKPPQERATYLDDTAEAWLGRLFGSA